MSAPILAFRPPSGEPPRDRAVANQGLASDPDVSAFVAASAGSGKTKLLTDRLLRLMLQGAPPARIQCLTFTKAAAAEMAVRLQRRLGAWVTMDDATLGAELQAVSVLPTAERLAQARSLFAEVLDLPGGMRIGTIHAFCQSLLRRFPIEAQLSPHFRLLEDIDADVAWREAREAMLEGAQGEESRAALAALAGLASAEQFGRLVRDLQQDRERLAALLAMEDAAVAAAQRRVLAVTGEEAEVLAAACAWDGSALRAALEVVAKKGAATCAEKAVFLLEWLSGPEQERVGQWSAWRLAFLLEDGSPRGPTTLVNKKLAEQRPDLAEALLAEQQRVLAVEDACRAARAAAASAALVRLAGPVAQLYAGRKEAGAQLDYDDLIGRTGRLLVDPGAAWVLYKLDGGLDHLLLDEVQDTAPAQWQIAGKLTEEFFAGGGAREDQRRTVFAVGDRKQSIYSFQGADPDEFERWRGLLRERVEAVDQSWRDVTLDVSFRSVAPVLDLVDAVFADPDAAEGVTEAGALRHLPDRAGHAGRVELWPLTPEPEAPPSEPWSVPDRNLGQTSAPQRLAVALADWIARETAGDTMLESRGRPLRAGDVLVLVRRRNAFARALVRALKARDVPVAGLDRLVLTEQPAVADLLALCDVLLLPEDDLQLAAVLTSPLGGLTDDSMMALALRRRGSLWAALRARAHERPDWAQAHDFITVLLGRVDYASPHALLVEALGRLGGRAKLFARLGPEAAEPVDELLAAALAYARSHPPSLQGFLHWLRQSGAEVKREAEGAGGLVRIMTVHGAKGLQAPLVILPDTTALPPEDGPLVWAEDPDGGPDVPIWSPRKELRCIASDQLRERAARRRREEHNRLLYVALTRAEDRLVVCGWQPYREPPEGTWHRLVRRGFERLGVTATAFDAVPDPWEGEMVAHGCAQARPPERATTKQADAPVATLPAWAGHAPGWLPGRLPDEPAPPQPLAPSRPEGIELGPVPEAASPLAARDPSGARFRRGQVAHALLQHLPTLPPPIRHAAALRYLARPGLGVNDASTLAGQVMAVLDHPDLAPLFGPEGRAEVPLTGIIDGVVVGGLVDRLAVLPGRVLVADYKTNRRPPSGVEEVPVMYLRQMAAYRAVLRAALPGREVSCILVWTTGVQVMMLPDALLDGHAPGAA
ncbi:DNA helicase [Rhodovastum atsumiense]|uniref:DNA 3'-5' helicase n=1 Tax=Rhodovastum atsumiense TaxID=504468 RepID=A0A5M6ISN9_9PROT|nr:double-strand break repair helicase AddA [Rhodovastum atsumiense]KAA5610909.1 double-strand break repair helicase AddA [Rhodovastum atsumiense]CAH2601524.1 DNA helicase [Rhodovastum atsumiense]